MMATHTTLFLSSSWPFQNHLKNQKAAVLKSLCQSSYSDQTHFPSFKKVCLPLQTHSSNSPQNHPSPLCKVQNLTKTHISYSIIELYFSLPCWASEDTVTSPEQVSDKISLESLLVSIDNFFNRYPFFVAGCTFIWLVVIPLTQKYFSKCKFISAVDAFRKLREDPSAQLLDIRDEKKLKYLRSPNLKILNKRVVQVEFSEGEEDGFVKKVKESFEDAANTVLCILDDADGNSMKAAALLFKSGFREAYAIKDGVVGQKGWLAIQETLLPPSVYIYANKKNKASQQAEKNGGIVRKSDDEHHAATSSDVSESESKLMDHKHELTESQRAVKIGSFPSSPYPNYPDMKPPSSPTPSKPCN